MQNVEHIHQVLIVDHFGPVAPLPPQIQANVASLKRIYPNARHHIWSGQTLRNFIATNFDKPVLDAFDLLTPYSFKADLARYCLLHAMGGLYVDVGVQFLRPIELPDSCGIATFREVDFATTSWTALQGAVIWAKPGRPEMRIAIENVVENCRRKFYGRTALEPTGPVLLGHAVTSALAQKSLHEIANDQWIGATRALTPEAGNRNLCYITPDRALVALRMKIIDADLAHLGVVGGNNYDKLWRSRCAYSESVPAWTFEDYNLRVSDAAVRTGTGIALTPNVNGIAIFGPYVDMEPGRYMLIATFRGVGVWPRMQVEVTRNFGTQILSVHHQPRRTATPTTKLEIELNILEPSEQCEFRLYFYEYTSLELVEVRLIQADQVARSSTAR